MITRVYCGFVCGCCWEGVSGAERLKKVEAVASVSYAEIASTRKYALRVPTRKHFFFLTHLATNILRAKRFI